MLTFYAYSGLVSAERCPGCYLPKRLCMCEQICPVPCGIEIIVLRHMRECERGSNTGRLVGAALASAKVLDYSHPERPLDLNLLTAANSQLLYPTQGVAPPAEPPTRLIILDATWSQARRMAQRIPQLRGMPCLALPTPSQPLPRLRNGLEPEQMSTAEAAIAALRWLGEATAADHLEALLRELVDRFRRAGHHASRSHGVLASRP